MRLAKKLSAFILASLLLVNPAYAQTDTAAVLAQTAQYIYQITGNPQVGSIGGEWAVLGLARSGYDVPDLYFARYYQVVESYVKEHQGVLDERKYTEYSRIILALTAAGYDPTSVAGYDLTLALGDFEKTVWQGLNGPIFALLALDSGNYPVPKNPEAPIQATRELYIQEILDRQLRDGGFSLSCGPSETADPDVTGMALQALARYREQPEVKIAIDRALVCLSTLQNEDGGFSNFREPNLESAAQVLVALCELGVSIDDPRFAKNGQNVLDNALTYRNGDGSFRHTPEGSGNNQMSTEQAFYALVAVQRAEQEKSSLYSMNDAAERNPVKVVSGGGLPGKHGDVRPLPIICPGKTFGDIAGHENQTAIEALASQGIIQGKGDAVFDPDATMTRAEFAAITTRTLGLEARPSRTFTDVPADGWHAGWVETAYAYGIITGISPTTFQPDGVITREQACAMIARAAGLCGVNTDRNEAEIRDTLSQFADYGMVSDWARSSLAFCYGNDILSQEEDIDINPESAVKRCEVAEMIYRLLSAAELL